LLLLSQTHVALAPALPLHISGAVALLITYTDVIQRALGNGERMLTYKQKILSNVSICTIPRTSYRGGDVKYHLKPPSP